MLIVGTLWDLATHEVPNEVVLLGGVLGVIFAGLTYGLTFGLAIHLLFAAIMAVASYVLFYFFNRFVGGADVKGLMALGLILSPFAFLVLGYAVFVTAGWLVVNVARKKIRNWKEFRAFEAPFFPFLLVGLILTFTTLIF